MQMQKILEKSFGFPLTEKNFIRSYVEKYITPPPKGVEKNILNTLIDLCEILEKYKEVYVNVKGGKKYSLCNDYIHVFGMMVDIFRHNEKYADRLAHIVYYYDKYRHLFLSDDNKPVSLQIFHKTNAIPPEWDLKKDKEIFIKLFISIEDELKKVVKLEELRAHIHMFSFI